MNAKKVFVKVMAVVLVLGLFLGTGCSTDNAETDGKKTDETVIPSDNTTEPETTPKSDEPQDNSSPSQTNDPTSSEEPIQSGNPTESPVVSEEPVQSANPTESPVDSENPSQINNTVTNDAFFYSNNLFPLRPNISIYGGTQTEPYITETPNRFEILNRLQLYASTGPGKPTNLPGTIQIITIPSMINPNDVFSDEPPEYSNGFRTAFVQEGVDEVLWFAWKSEGKGISSVVWQISDRPFLGSGSDYENPPGLLKSGVLAENEKEFSVDFSKLHSFSPGYVFIMPGFSLINPPLPIVMDPVDYDRVNPEQKIYYVRAFAKDSSGSVLGEPDKGIEVIYGDRIDYIPQMTEVKFLFELLFGASNGPAGAQKEFFNSFLDTYERTYEPTDSGLLYFRPEGFPKDTDTIMIQVLTTEPSTNAGSWRDPVGLVYEKKVEKGNEDFDDFVDEDHGIGIDVKAFAENPPTSYYVRAVALSDGPVAGTVMDSYSKSVRLNYGPVESQFEYYIPPKIIYLDPGLPDLEMIEYKHHRDDDPEWMYYYEVVRQPTYADYYAMMPSMYVGNANEPVEGLTPGTVMYIKPKEDSDDGWWEKVKNAISDVFGSLKNFVADLTNWVSSAYADLKADMIAFVADNMPLVPDEFRDDLKKALETMVDSGLASMGIPPELPNFDQLTSMGADYIAATALEQAGIPADEWTVDMVKDLGAGIADKANEAASSGNSPNPFGWNFVRQNPGTMYQPAYIMIKLTNNTDKVSPGGTLSGKVFTSIKSSELSDPNKMWLSSSFGGTLYFELYRPVNGLKIPKLQPGQTMEIPVFLEKYTGMAYPFDPHVVTENDFGRLYSHLGEYTFSFRIDYELPPVDDYAEEKGLEPSGRYHTYEYTDSSENFGFKGVPWEDR